jgi:hypothetical protein
MAVTEDGAWFPTLPDSPAQPSVGYGELLSGTGAPATDLGRPGDAYINLSNGNLYVRNNAGWELVTGGSGGVAQVIAGAPADPNVAVIEPDDPTQGAIYTQNGAGLTNLWRWDSAALTWIQQLA